MSNILIEVMNSNEAWAYERASYAIKISEAVDRGELSTDEAKELLEDLISTDVLEEESSNSELRAALVFGVTQIISAMA